MKSRAPVCPEIRVEIDAIDGEILKLLNKRSKFGAPGSGAKIKRKGAELVFKPLRERVICWTSWPGENPGPLPDEHPHRHLARDSFPSSRAQLCNDRKTSPILAGRHILPILRGVEYLGHAASFHPCRDILQIFLKKCARVRANLSRAPGKIHYGAPWGWKSGPFSSGMGVWCGRNFIQDFTLPPLPLMMTFSSIKGLFPSSAPLALVPAGLALLRTNLPNAALVPVEIDRAAAAKRAASDSSAAIGGNFSGLPISTIVAEILASGTHRG